MRTLRPLSALLLFVTVSACATDPTYAPAKNDRSSGYSSQAIEQNRYRVTYRGGDAATARDFALLRAAELTLSQGHEWFRVINTYTDEDEERSRPSVSVGGGVGSYGGNTSSGVGVGIGFPLGGSSSRTEHSIEILIGSGPKPSEPNVYDAQSIVDTIGARTTSR